MGQSAGSGNNTSQPQPFQAQPQPFQAQPQPFQPQPFQPQPFQPQPFQPQPFQPQPFQPQPFQPQPFQAQPQPFQPQPIYNTRNPFTYQPQVLPSLQATMELLNRSRLGARQPQPMYDQAEAQPLQAQPLQAQPLQAQPLQAQPMSATAASPSQPNPFFGGVTPRSLPPASTDTRQPGNPGFPDPSTIYTRPSRPFGQNFVNSLFGANRFAFAEGGSTSAPSHVYKPTYKNYGAPVQAAREAGGLGSTPQYTQYQMQMPTATRQSSGSSNFARPVQMASMAKPAADPNLAALKKALTPQKTQYDSEGQAYTPQIFMQQNERQAMLDNPGKYLEYAQFIKGGGDPSQFAYNQKPISMMSQTQLDALTKRQRAELNKLLPAAYIPSDG